MVVQSSPADVRRSITAPMPVKLPESPSFIAAISSAVRY